MSSEVKRKSWQAAKARLPRITQLFCDRLFFVCWSWPTVRALEAADGTDDDRGPVSAVRACVCVYERARGREREREGDLQGFHRRIHEI